MYGSILRKTLLIPGYVAGDDEHDFFADASLISRGPAIFYDVVYIPITIIVTLWLLYSQVQFSFLYGLLVILIIIPVNRFIAYNAQLSSAEVSVRRDARSNIMSTIMKRIKDIRMTGLDGWIANQVFHLRKVERRARSKFEKYESFSKILWAAASLVFSTTTFYV